MTEEMEIKVLDLIYDKAMEAIGQGWIEDTINLSVFSGWMQEAANLCDGVGEDAMGEFGYDNALENYCWFLQSEEAISDYEWDFAHQKMMIKKVEE